MFTVFVIIPLTGYADAQVAEHSLIKLFSEKIKDDPQNPELYFKRASQHRYAGHFERSLADFIKAKSLDPEYSLVDLGMGLVFLDSGWYKTAEVYLKSFLKNSPYHIVGMTSLARTLARQQRGRESAALYMQISKNIDKPAPEFYLEMADSYLLTKNYPEAIKALDTGIDKLGHITSLDQKALEIELLTVNRTAALLRLDSLIKYSPQKERWLYEKGQVLESEGNYKQAEASYLKALDHYNSRPPKRRNIPVLLKLKETIDLSLDRLRQR
ncbi:MAG: tetratricopeptide repeat protein [Candidatus Dadabacteria bacterium]|nr:tetratricopeptide repeat protein [Candidatus Dadabacteria bacterium]NIS08045.1 tetratricopeptide repeat protein [Candidatus Dadabacteria bacterium]NIV40868.1 tetratricopeptide repeat protein [Candidatus Dadabacteria bacterium]NIY21623.1 tetratricopeptide repeat protein [Candidatus Dadabacteria bacterium]